MREQKVMRLAPLSTGPSYSVFRLVNGIITDALAGPFQSRESAQRWLDSPECPHPYTSLRPTTDEDRAISEWYASKPAGFDFGD